MFTLFFWEFFVFLAVKRMALGVSFSQFHVSCLSKTDSDVVQILRHDGTEGIVTFSSHVVSFTSQQRSPFKKWSSRIMVH